MFALRSALLRCPAATGFCRRTPFALAPVTLYSTSHEWITWDKDAKTAVLGITQHAQEQLGDVVFVELKNVGDKLEPKDVFGNIESIKATSELMNHVDGTVAEINPQIVAQPGIVNESPETDGWMLKLKDVEAVPESLMARDKYDKFVETGSN